ncbi:PLP-dependent aminotransferase family protein [Kocuria coralli]|uniref:PLP-dependent aminotransferase family protein n=1 Tax=Kocuria coralli TaxID=1461025 RepID=A0A5J5KYE1_9MICC|nr:PLP-dependent aminotransferase family protein [Kocuria coralli]KAA9394320.1 PLP-dependent aminotransferase family protein [Kocuria coralli]
MPDPENAPAGTSRPLHQQVRETVETALREGAYPPRRPIPSSRFLAQSMGVSRGTVLTALNSLVAEGLLISRPRSGLYPSPTVAAAGPPPSGEASSPGPGGPPADGDESAVDWQGVLLRAGDPWQSKSVSDPDYLSAPYPFLSGQVNPATFPTRAWIRALTRAFDGPHAGYTLRDAVDTDDPLLVKAVTTFLLPLKGIHASPEQVIVTSGTQQALALLADALLDGTRTVAMEDPGYLDAARIFHGRRARLEFFDVDERGVRPDYSRPFDLLYVTPSHQHPTNVTLSPDRRAEILGQAAERDFLVIEDDYDSEIRYVGAPTPPLRAADDSGRVIYLGTFSKFLTPALRLGFVVAAEPLIAELRERRYLATKHPSGVDQRALGHFIESGSYQTALRWRRKELQRNWAGIGEALAEHFPWQVPTPPGGLNYWITGPAGFDATALAAGAREHGVIITPGERYHLRPEPPRNSFRLGFSAIPHARILPGIRVLSRLAEEAAAAQP